MSTFLEMQRLLAEIEAVLPALAFKELPDAPIKMYEGLTEEWRILIANHGDTYVGTGTKGGTIIRLTAKLAEKTFKLAEAQVQA